MAHLLGEFECKVDAKGRLRFPSQLIKQLGEAAMQEFVVNRGFEKCLVVYPKKEWKRITNQLNELNQFVQQNRDFVRYFHRGATEIEMDDAARILLPKRLMEYAEIGSDIVVLAYFDKIELWAQASYDALIANEPADFSHLAEVVMGKKDE